jgi:GNAT superfamily N-acetyltransferase
MTVETSYGADRQTVLDTLTEAFMDDPVVSWLFPDETERRRLQPHFFGSLLTHPQAEAYLVPGGASIWLPLPAPPHEEPQPRTDVFGENGSRLLALGEALARHRPQGEPYLYLPCMGVVPAARGNGIGSALLRDRLDRAGGLDAYLEASSPRSRTLYLRHGFTDLGDPVQVLDSPPLWPMWRPATNGATR